MKLPKVSEFNLKDKKVLLRADLDVENDDFRLQTLKETLHYLIEIGAKIIVIGHRGRPQGIDGRFSLLPVAQKLGKLINKKINFVFDVTGQETKDEIGKMKNGDVVMLENLRFDKGEEENDPKFAKRLALMGDFYLNESFADCHREHSSIVVLPLQFKSKSNNSTAAGFHLTEEIENLSRVLERPKRPVVIIIGGSKTEKAKYIDKLLDSVDWVLAGGLLPHVVSSYCRSKDGKTCVAAAHLTPSGGDIDQASATNFAAIARVAGTIVWNGPLGEYEKKEYRSGTEIMAKAVAQNRDAYKIVGGGDTISALKKIGVLEKMDWVSTGGGAMLEYLAYGTLPGIEALKAQA